MEILRESTPLTDNDCFMIFSRKKASFDFPLHTHQEMELNLVMNAAGASRVIGNHVGAIGDMELVLVSGDTPHAWFTDRCTSKDIHEITLQFSPDLLDDRLLNRNPMAALRSLFAEAKRGVLFSRGTTERMAPRIRDLYEQGSAGGMKPLLDMIMILNDLSLSTDREQLSDVTFVQKKLKSHSVRIETVFTYMNQNFNRQISLSETAALINMSDVSFSRFIKKVTGQSFIDTLTEIRLGHVARMLIDTDMTIAEIAFCCGFNNMANFNRIFKRKKGMPPHKFRTLFLPKKVFV